MLFLEKNPDLFPRPKFCSCKVRTHATEISQLKLMGNVAYVCISKNKPLNPYPVVLYKIVGTPSPPVQKNLCPPAGLVTHASGNPQLKSMGNIPFGRFSVKSPKHPTLLYCISLWRPDLAISGEKSRPFSPTKILPCKVRTHATEISQLKLMGNVAYVCISKNKPLNPYPVVLYKIVGSPPPHLCKKICVRRPAWSGDIR